MINATDFKPMWHSKCKGNKFQVSWNGSKMMAKCMKCRKIFLLLKLNSSTSSWR